MNWVVYLLRLAFSFPPVFVGFFFSFSFLGQVSGIIWGGVRSKSIGLEMTRKVRVCFSLNGEKGI